MMIGAIVASAGVAAAATATAATVAIGAIASGVRVAKKAHLKREPPDVDRSPPSLLPPPQELPVLRPERAEDRLQGYAPALALHFRARQDRAVAHHCRVREEAARARACDQ